MPRSYLRTAIVTAAAAALLTAGGAYAVDVALDPGASAVVLDRPVTIKEGEPNPVDFPGVRGDRPGEPLRAGYTAVGYPLTVTRGDVAPHATFTMRCPRGKGLVTVGVEGDVAVQLVGPTPFVRRTRVDYRGRRSWAVIVDYNARELAKGATITGTVYALCR